MREREREDTPTEPSISQCCAKQMEDCWRHAGKKTAFLKQTLRGAEGQTRIKLREPWKYGKIDGDLSGENLGESCDKDELELRRVKELMADRKRQQEKTKNKTAKKTLHRGKGTLNSLGLHEDRRAT